MSGLGIVVASRVISGILEKAEDKVAMVLAN